MAKGKPYPKPDKKIVAGVHQHEAKLHKGQPKTKLKLGKK